MGDKIGRNKPEKITIINNIISICVGENHTLILKNDNTVYVYGNNTYGQLGLNDNNERLLPVQIPNIDDVIQICAGSNCSLLLKNDGLHPCHILWIW